MTELYDIRSSNSSCKTINYYYKIKCWFEQCNGAFFFMNCLKRIPQT